MSLVDTFLHLKSADPLISSTKSKIIQSISILQQALDNFTIDEISLSYNGGKDCLVLLILYLSVIPKDHQQPINAVFIHYEEQFPDLVQFIEESSQTYNLQLKTYKNSLKLGFEQYLKDEPKIKAILVGTRRSDPFSADLQDFQKTDNDWPSFTRIHPILDWKYDEIWCFLKTLNISYCNLYDKGFTSLGGVHTTIPNPKLLQNDSYLPAFQLKGDSDELERLGREG